MKEQQDTGQRRGPSFRGFQGPPRARRSASAPENSSLMACRGWECASRAEVARGAGVRGPWRIEFLLALHALRLWENVKIPVSINASVRARSVKMDKSPTCC